MVGHRESVRSAPQIESEHGNVLSLSNNLEAERAVLEMAELEARRRAELGAFDEILRALRARARFLLTGTPLENRALDLWSISSFVNPGHLGSQRSFVERHDSPETPPHMRALLSARLRPVLLRRLKSQVARELPPRIEERQDCGMTTDRKSVV